MTTIKQEYSQYLLTNFAKQKIKAPLFFNGKFGLRFDLQVGDTNTDDYFTQVIKRSTALFKAAFGETDEIFVLYRDYKWKRKKIRFANYCFKQIQGIQKQEIAYSVVKNLYATEKDDIYNIAILKTSSNKVNYKNILTAIANTDFPPRRPRFKFLSNIEIYFINITKNLIFHMYDDRGLDVIATNKEILKPLYIEFNDWILEVNREKIDDIMSEKGQIKKSK